MKILFAIWLFIGYSPFTNCQSVEIQGEAKITQMTNDNSIDDIVIRKPDGTLGTRSASSLPANDPDTTRNLSTDFNLAKHMCDCGNDLPAFMIESLLANGYTKEDLLRAGVPFEKIEDQNPIFDGDGNEYTFVTIGNQRWLKENLKTTSYNDGSAIPNQTSNADWANANTNEEPAYAWLNNSINNMEPFGALYNWYAIDSTSNGNKNVCPVGWHVPTNQDHIDLMKNLDAGGSNNSNFAGSKMKEEGFDYWNSGNTEATNSSGFSALGAGFRLEGGVFSGYTYNSYFHAREAAGSNSYNSFLFHSHLKFTVNLLSDKGRGKSVRCVQYILE